MPALYNQHTENTENLLKLLTTYDNENFIIERISHTSTNDLVAIKFYTHLWNMLCTPVDKHETSKKVYTTYFSVLSFILLKFHKFRIHR